MTAKINKLDCVLLIDDDEATNFYHTVILEDEVSGIHIQAVNSAKEGIEYLLAKGEYKECPQPGIIFLDINMPGLNGWDFLMEYNELSKDIHNRSVVVMLSTSLNPDDRERAYSIPVVKEFVNKPLTPEVFWKVVNDNFN
ncbi:response regulator [Algoriphagus lacus]|uniref:Response regulator n=1 Tax=Algoriphagus lacus TaxID=2056311 RepID=A0A418PN89_9BACT|nr:response regulator [Algoriphagus lacus]RIW12974.1 response regulator [Algoriphagus lacus]